ncbi:sulfotransferase 1A3-like [Littorina saxatilis]|uniref:Sulfotransferase domain-containing protein n=1 Tax=Littorina saxatilis TaxID=31220 RepID=A0AAN9G191_9CAEN
MEKSFSHKLPGEHVYKGVLFFGYSPPGALDAVKDLQVREDDVFIVTYPKAGTTWLQEILWLIMHDGDFARATSTPVYLRSPFIEFKDDVLGEDGLDLANKIDSPRVLKTHLQHSFMPMETNKKNCKIVVLFRNPKDVCTSYFHFYRSSSSFGQFKGTWPDFLDMFLAGHVDHGSWFDFTASWWQQRNRDNVYLMYYEHLKENTLAELEKLAQFVGKGQLSTDLLSHIAEHCSFGQMKTNPMTNHLDVYSINSHISPLLRKGEIGDWRTQFTVEQDEIFNRVYAEKLGHLDIPFQYRPTESIGHGH